MNGHSAKLILHLCIENVLHKIFFLEFSIYDFYFPWKIVVYPTYPCAINIWGLETSKIAYINLSHIGTFHAQDDF